MPIKINDKENKNSRSAANANNTQLEGTSSALPPKQLFSTSKTEENAKQEKIVEQPKQTAEKSQKDSEQIISLLSIKGKGNTVTESEESEILNILQNTTSLDTVIREIKDANKLKALVKRVDSITNRRSLLQLLGSKLNAENKASVMPFVKKLGVEWEMQMNLWKHGITSSTSDFDPSPYQDLVSKSDLEPFTGSGATGKNPTSLSRIPMLKQVGIVTGIGPAKKRHKNPLKGRYEEVEKMSEVNRSRQAELLLNQEISSIYEASYAGEVPSRVQVVKAAADQYNLEPELVAAMLLVEQRDQSSNEDRADFQAATSIFKNTSIGLGQVRVDTAKKDNLFSGLLSTSSNNKVNKNHNLRAKLLASDEMNIFATAKYIRVVADLGYAKYKAGETNPSNMTKTYEEYPFCNFRLFNKHSREWHMDNKKALASEYTSAPWNDLLVTLWGDQIEIAYTDVVRAGIF